MRLRRIRELCEVRSGGIKKLASDIGMTEANLHRRINANDIKASDLELIARVLNVSVTYFFDDDTEVGVRQAGRDYVESGKIEHNGTEYNGPHSTADLELIKENDDLKRKLIDAQERIIELISK